MRTAAPSIYEPTIQRSIERLVGAPDAAPDFHALARDAGLSAFHFHRLFRGLVGETPLELVRRVRLERAAAALRDRTDAILTVALDAGYESHEAFTRAFRAAYGISPSGYRRQRWRRIEIAAPCGIHYRADGRLGAFSPREPGGIPMQVTIETMPELRVGAVRHVGPYNQIISAFERLDRVVRGAGLRCSGLIAIFHDDPEVTPPDALRSDAAVVVDDTATLPPGLAEQYVPGGRYAKVVHVGPYEGLTDAWARFIGDWFPHSGYALGPGVSYERYVNTPETAAPADLRTELFAPLA